MGSGDRSRKKRFVQAAVKGTQPAAEPDPKHLPQSARSRASVVPPVVDPTSDFSSLGAGHSASNSTSSAQRKPRIWIAGYEEEVLREDGVAAVVADLGAPTRIVDLWGAPLEPKNERNEENAEARVLIVEVLDRPDLLASSLKALRKSKLLEGAPVLAVVGPRAITSLEAAAGHSDFLVWPAPPSELYARIRQLEWRVSAYATDDVVKLGPLIIDKSMRAVSIEGVSGDNASVELTAREFSLLLALIMRRGRVLTRETLLDVAWGSTYDGGAKTVDVHVRRLRAKLGEALPLRTIRGSGYVIR